MKKTFLLLPICLLSISAAFAQGAKKQTDLAADNVKGNVKQVTQKYFEAGQKDGKDTVGNPFESIDRNYTINYNSNGYITSATFYKTGSTLDYRYTFKYDETGNRIEETWFDADDALDYRITRKFSNKGFLMELKKYTDTTAPFTEKYVYEPDPTGNPVKVSLYDESNALINYSTYVYDVSGNRIEENNFDGKGKAIGKTVCTYDSRHLKTSEDAFKADGSVMTKKKFVYEYRGKLSQQQNYDNNGKLVEKNTYSFNDQGEESDWSSYDRTGFLAYKYTFTYEYDAQGNWIKKTQLKDSKPVFVSFREIVYN